MSALLSILTGLMVAGAIYLMLDRNLVKYLFGLILLSNAANLILFNAGRLTEGRPALVPRGMEIAPEDVANALPQALILTAIVIGFGLLAFALVLAYRTHEELGTVDLDDIALSPYEQPQYPSDDPPQETQPPQPLREPPS